MLRDDGQRVWREADLSGAKLHQAIIDDNTRLDPERRLVWELVNQKAEGRQLMQADLSEADLRGAYLRGADLRGAKYRHSLDPVEQQYRLTE